MFYVHHPLCRSILSPWVMSSPAVFLHPIYMIPKSFPPNSHLCNQLPFVISTAWMSQVCLKFVLKVWPSFSQQSSSVSCHFSQPGSCLCPVVFPSSAITSPPPPIVRYLLRTPCLPTSVFPSSAASVFFSHVFLAAACWLCHS